MRSIIVWIITAFLAVNLHASDLTLAEKLKLEIKSIKLNQVTFNQAIETLRRHAKEIDPAKRGINIIVKQSDNNPAKKITLNLTNIPLRDAIKYVCKSAGLSMSANEHVVMISKTEKMQLHNKFYRVSSGFRSFVNPRKPVDINLKNLKEFFTIGGVSFPKGATVAYIPAKNLLSMSNTLENQEKTRRVLVGLNCLR